MITDHAYDKAKERLKWNKKTLDRMAAVALSKGMKHSEARGHVKKFFDKLWLDYKTANNIKVYGEVVYVFNNNLLITIYPLPSNLKKLYNAITKNL